jgi:hypothetical protein
VARELGLSARQILVDLRAGPILARVDALLDRTPGEPATPTSSDVAAELQAQSPS